MFTELLSWRNLLAAFIHTIDGDGITYVKIYKLLICWCFRIEQDSEGEAVWQSLSVKFSDKGN